MGMAAGQARLLSITQRLSDNELRAQIINNNKMRLASESSQVSDHYVQALNEAQLMFTNYDKDNNASFKQLTYNALTSFNPYNNQYALTNASGNILLSENDAKNYRSSDTLEDFLKCYDLEKTTTFFDNLETDGNGYAIFTNPTVEDDPATVENEQTHMSSGITPEDLEKAYLGNDEYKRVNDLTEDQTINMNPSKSIQPNGYKNTLNSEKYNEYFRYLDKYNEKWDNFQGCLAAIMSKTLDKDVVAAVTNNSYDSIDKFFDEINKAENKERMGEIMDSLVAVIQGANGAEGARSTNYTITDPADKANEVQEYYNTLLSLLDKNRNSDIVTMLDPVKRDSSGSTIFEGYGNNFRYAITHNTSDPYGPATSIVFYDYYNKENPVHTIPINDWENPYTTEGAEIKVKNASGEDIHIKIQLRITYNPDPSKNEYYIEEILKDQNTLDNMKNIAKTVTRGIKGSLANCWDPFAGDTNPPTGNGTFTKQEPAHTYFEEWDKAAQDLGECMFGSSYSGTPPKTQLGDPYVLYQAMNEPYTDRDRDPLKVDGPNGTAYKDGDGNPTYPTYGPIGKEFDEEFYQVFLNIMLDKIQDTYGEPTYTWIDTSSEPTGTDSYNVNGEAKARWYENIWNMCEKNGYRILKDGLASSADWIQYAFESGIVNMQQVDTNGNWNPLIYSNCSDITSQTSDKIIAQAEAEYSAAMNKIENKDKRFDLELKNIDTEHNSLQTEYESIKAAIDKNIERVFKLYS